MITLVVAPIPPGTTEAVLVPVLLLVLVLATWAQMRGHDAGLCELCLATMPLNPAELATRLRRRFRYAHADRRLVVGYLVVLVASNIVLLDERWVAPVQGRWLWALIQASMVYLVLAYSTHRRLQPWCPHCRGGDKDDHEVGMPGPMPSGRGRS